MTPEFYLILMVIVFFIGLFIISAVNDFKKTFVITCFLFDIVYNICKWGLLILLVIWIVKQLIN